MQTTLTQMKKLRRDYSGEVPVEFLPGYVHDSNPHLLDHYDSPDLTPIDVVQFITLARGHISDYGKPFELSEEERSVIHLHASLLPLILEEDRLMAAPTNPVEILIAREDPSHPYHDLV